MESSATNRHKENTQDGRSKEGADFFIAQTVTSCSLSAISDSYVRGLNRLKRLLGFMHLACTSPTLIEKARLKYSNECKECEQGGLCTLSSSHPIPPNVFERQTASTQIKRTLRTNTTEA